MFSLLLAIAITPAEDFALNENPELEASEIVFIDKTENELSLYAEKEIKQTPNVSKSFKQIEQ